MPAARPPGPPAAARRGPRHPARPPAPPPPPAHAPPHPSRATPQGGRIGGKGTVRRKKKTVHKAASMDDKRLQSTLKRLGVNNIPGIEEVSAERESAGRVGRSTALTRALPLARYCAGEHLQGGRLHHPLRQPQG